MTVQTYELRCDKCEKFVGKYANNGSDHLIAFMCKDCLEGAPQVG